MNNDLFVISVGDIFPIKVHEGISICLDQTGFMVIVSLPGLSFGEIKAFSENEINLKLCKVDSQVAFFHIYIKDLFDGDVAFTILNTPYGVNGLIADENSYVNAFTFVLVESTNSQVAALRVIGTSQDFAKEIYNVSKEQDAYGLNDYHNAVISTQMIYSQQDIVNKFTIAEYSVK